MKGYERIKEDIKNQYNKVNTRLKRVDKNTEYGVYRYYKNELERLENLLSIIDKNVEAIKDSK